jgi:hypothetical protein
VGARVADVGGDGVAAVLLEDGGEAPVDLLEGLVPGRLDELAVASGVVSRSGSSCSSFSPCAFGQMKPWLKTSSLSPRTEITRSPSSVTSRPQVASPNGQVR